MDKCEKRPGKAIEKINLEIFDPKNILIMSRPYWYTKKICISFLLGKSY